MDVGRARSDAGYRIRPAMFRGELRPLLGMRLVERAEAICDCPPQ